MEQRDLRSWITAVEKLGELKVINGADWDVEIGAITELGHHRGEQSKALLFDNIKGYPEGYRVLSNNMNTVNRVATTLHMEAGHSRLDFIHTLKRRINDIKYIKPEVVKAGPVMENVFEGKDINMWNSRRRSGTNSTAGVTSAQARLTSLATPMKAGSISEPTAS